MNGIFISNVVNPASPSEQLFQNSSVRIYINSQTEILKTFFENPAKRTGIAIFGEIISIRDYFISDLSDAEKLYFHLVSGNNIIDVNGLYVSVLFNDNSITVSNDRYGTYPVYIYEKEKDFIISTDLPEIMSVINPELDEQNSEEYLVLGFLLQPKTVFKNVRRLLPGSTLTVNFSNTNWVEKSYFQAQFEIDSGVTESDFYFELENSIRKSVEKQSGNMSAALTGGWDSRLTWSFILKNRYKSVSSFSHDVSNCNDQKMSQLISDVYHIKHKKVVFNYKDLINFSMSPTYFLHGIQDFTNLHLIHSYEHQRSLHDCVIDSAGSEFFRRYYLSLNSVNNSVEQISDDILLSTGVKKSNWSNSNIIEGVKNSLITELKTLANQTSDSGQLLDLFYLKHRLFSNNTTTFQVNHVISRMPFLDNNLVDLGFRMSTDLKSGNNLHLFCIRKNKPSLQFFPVDHAGEWTLMTSNKFLKYGIIALQRAFNSIVNIDKNDRYIINHNKMIQSAKKGKYHSEFLNELKNKYLNNHRKVSDSISIRLNNIALTQSLLNEKKQ